MGKEQEKRALKKIAKRTAIGILSSTLVWGGAFSKEPQTTQNDNSQNTYHITIPNASVDYQQVPIDRLLKTFIPPKNNTPHILVPEAPPPTTIVSPQLGGVQAQSIDESFSTPVFPEVKNTPSDAVWNLIANACESGGNWSIVDATGTYYGGLQFDIPTWRSVGGKGIPSEASKSEQIYRAKLLWKKSGFSPWPACARRLGLLK